MLTDQDWDNLFPERWGVGRLWKREYRNQPFYYPEMERDYYSYENFCRALQWANALGLTRFLNEPGTTPTDRLRELVAFLATIAYQTRRGKNGLFYREALTHERFTGGKIQLYNDVKGYADFEVSNRPSYHRVGSHLAGEMKFPQQSYHGRGPMMLTGAHNYGLFSEFVYGNPDKLLQNPDMLLENGKLAFLSAIWYWMTEKGGRISGHRALYRRLKPCHTWGYGHAIVDMSSGAEANAKEGGYTEKDCTVTNRIDFYRKFASRFDIPIGTQGEQLDTRGLS